MTPRKKATYIVTVLTVTIIFSIAVVALYGSLLGRIIWLLTSLILGGVLALVIVYGIAILYTKAVEAMAKFYENREQEHDSGK